MSQANIKPYIRLMAKSAAIFLLEQLKNVEDLGKDRMIMEFIASTASSIKAKPRYTTIWDLNILLDFIRKSPPLHGQSMNELIPRVVALLMIFAMVRPVEIFRMAVSEIVIEEDGSQWTIPTHRKTDRGVEMPDKAICPVCYLEELRHRAYDESLPLFHWDNGVSTNSAVPIYNALAKLLATAGIPSKFTSYSIRHAAITKLYSMGHTPTKVNTFTWHSQRADTSSRFYLHQVDQWLGFDLANAPRASNPIVKRRAKEDGAFAVESVKSDDERAGSDLEQSDPDSESDMGTQRRARSASPKKSRSRTSGQVSHGKNHRKRRRKQSGKIQTTL
jgi:integrase